MLPTNKTILCPRCGKNKLEIVSHPTKEGRVVAYDDCQGGAIGVVAVWEADAEPAKPEVKDGK